MLRLLGSFRKLRVWGRRHGCRVRRLVQYGSIQAAGFTFQGANCKPMLKAGPLHKQIVKGLERIQRQLDFGFWVQDIVT